MYATKPLMFIAILAVFSSVMAQRRLMAGAPIAEATLSGTKQMPPINTMTTGTFTLMPGAASGEWDFTLDVMGVKNMTMAHIHWGNATSSGNIVVDLVPLPGEPSVTTSGLKMLANPYSGSKKFEGTFSTADFMAELKGKTAAQFKSYLSSPDNMYVNVHNVAYPAGVIRGQLCSSCA